MLKEKIKLPVAFQLRVDDVAWHNGKDDRVVGGPSRTGIPRKHSWMDYPVINEIGKGINQKISCSIVLGEWDKDNLLRGQKGLSWNPDGWDRASEIDMDYAQKAFEIMESSEYIDYTWHGVLHGHYADDGSQITERELYNLKYDENLGRYTHDIWHTDDVLKKHLDYFFKIYDSWGFKKKVKSIACGNGNFGVPSDEGNINYARIFKEYGFDVWQDVFVGMVDQTSEVIEGLVCLRINTPALLLPWEAYGCDPDYMPPYHKEGETNYYPDFVTHWVNYLRFNPEHNLEYVPRWIEYYKRQAETFGYMISRDVLFAASQATYNRYSKLSFEENKCIIDLADVDAQKARALKNEFYISIQNGTVPTECIGGKISVYETKNDFVTYQIQRESSDKIIIVF